jgi:hypothetical protein
VVPALATEAVIPSTPDGIAVSAREIQSPGAVEATDVPLALLWSVSVAPE